MTSRDKTTDREYPKATQQSTALRLLGERTRMSLHGLHTHLHTVHRGSARHCCRRFRQLVTRQLTFLHFTSHECIPLSAHIHRMYSTVSSHSPNIFHCQLTLNCSCSRTSRTFWSPISSSTSLAQLPEAQPGNDICHTLRRKPSVCSKRHHHNA